MNTENSITIKGEGMARGQTVVIKELPLNKIKLGRNSRLAISQEDLSGLMQSINSVGLLEPIGVVDTEDGKGWEIAYGNRRFMAFSKLGLHSIPCVIHKRRNDNDVDVKNLAENVQRRNISLAEIGRYAKILEAEGLGLKELAVRLGTSVNYVRSCVEAYQEVPKEYRDDLQAGLTGQRPEPGKISIRAAQSIVNAVKKTPIPKVAVDALYVAAKSDDRFDSSKVPDYIAAMKKGVKDPIGSVRRVRATHISVMIYEDDWEKLEAKFVDSGPFKSVTALMRAVLKGEKAVKIPIID